MIHANTLLRRGSVLVTGALLLGLLQAGPAYAAGDEDQFVPVTRSQGDDMVSVDDGTGTSDRLRSQDQTLDDGIPLAAYSQSNHTVNVAVVAPRDAGTDTSFISDAAITAMLAQVGASWNVQSNNQVLSVAVSGPILRYTSGYSCAEQTATWTEAAGQFNRSPRSYSTTAAQHLLVLVPKACASSGLGTVGINTSGSASANYGGVMWVSIKGYGDTDTVTHEFGHNLGLNHSNSHKCPVATISEGLVDAATGAFSDGCADTAYGDFFDVMGPTWVVNGTGGVVYTNARPTALNVTHKIRLGAVANGEMVALALPAGSATWTQTYSLASVGLSSGLRDVAVTDPQTGLVYYVDYRGGQGTDAGSLYESGKLVAAGTAMGVRLLTTRADGASIVLNSPERAPRTGSKLYLVAGETLSNRSGGVTVVVNSAGDGSANVTIKLASAGAVPVPSAPAPTVARISGDDRYATAVEVSQTGFPSTAPIVYVATGANYPDALAAAPAAALAGGPLLLTDAGVLPASVATEIRRLSPSRIVVVGGPNAVSPSVFNSLKQLASRVDRIDGIDRYETARKIVADAFGRVNEAYLATALDYPDALSAAAAAGARGVPVLLVDGRAAAVDSGTRGLISSLGIKKLTIAGGTAVVSSGIEATLKSTGLTVARQGGSDRFETSRLINQAAFSTAAEMFIATGHQFPDALAGAVLAGSRTAPLYVVPPSCVPVGVVADVTRLGASKVTLIGGVNALSTAVGALTTCA